MKIKRLKDIYKYNKKVKYRFHMPGNFGGKSLVHEFASNMPYFETTEVKGMDDYHLPEGIIKKGEKELSDLFGSKKSIFLVNGSTAGIIASMSYLFKEGDQVLVCRNSHKSVQYGFIVSGAKPIYFVNPYDNVNEIYLPPTYQSIYKQLQNNNKVKGVIITSPNYFGVGTKELKKIYSLCCSRGIKVLLDESHGSHLYFSKLGIFLGNENNIDIVVNSFHKNLTGLTQTAMLHINNSSISKNQLRKHISLVTTTSPSYILLASMDFCNDQYNRNGVKILEETQKKACYLKDLLDKYKIRYIEGEHLEKYYFDPTKVTVKLDSLGLANKVYNTLLALQVYPEMLIDDKIVFFINKEMSKKQIAKLSWYLNIAICRNKKYQLSKSEIIPIKKIPKSAVTPRNAFYGSKETIAIHKSVGRVCATIVTPYPPGIPLIMPGEEISQEALEYLKNTHSSVHGVKNGMIEVVM